MVLSFFFSSRRRHTRFDCDWSSDVCSSDLRCRPSICFREPGGPDLIATGQLIRHHRTITESSKQPVAGTRDTTHGTAGILHLVADPPPQIAVGSIERIRVLTGREVHRSTLNDE